MVPSPPPPIVATQTVAAGPHTCKFHPNTPARFLCNKCRHYFCELCVTTRAVGNVTHKTCRHCGTECVPVQVQLQRVVQAGFFKRIPWAFAYPFRGAGVFLVMVGIIISSSLKYGALMISLGRFWMLVCGVIMQIIAGGYLFTFLQAIIHSTAAGDREMPELPGMSNFLEDILLPFFRLLGLTLICFGPAVAVGLAGVPAPAIYATAILGALYFPMAFLAVAILDSVGAANPLVVMPSILKVPLEYVVTLVLLAVVFGLRPLGDFLIGAAFPKSLNTTSMSELLAYLGANAFWGFMRFYLLIVAVHILALLYVAKKDKLAWLDR